MSFLEALILGILQGLTEFLPVSSSGHIELGKAILNVHPKDPLMFSVVVHFATAMSTIIIYRKDVVRIISGLTQFKKNEETLFSLKIVLSMIPAGIIGYFFDDALEVLFNENIVLVGSMLLVTAILLLVAEKIKSSDKEVGFGHAIIIGLAQAVALLPGISRSGATIATSLILGIKRPHAAQFSFLMVVPLIFGKIAKDLLDGNFGGDIPAMVLFAGFIAAFVTGLVACKWMVYLVKKSSLIGFSIYCFVVGMIALMW